MNRWRDDIDHGKYSYNMRRFQLSGMSEDRPYEQRYLLSNIFIDRGVQSVENWLIAIRNYR